MNVSVFGMGIKMTEGEGKITVVIERKQRQQSLFSMSHVVDPSVQLGLVLKRFYKAKNNNVITITQKKNK